MSLTDSTLRGRVVGTYLCLPPDDLISTPQKSLTLAFGGAEGDRHFGLTHRSDGRTPHYPRDTEIRNTRQISIVSVEELAEVASAMGIPRLCAEWLGANLLLEGIPAFSLLPPSTRLLFSSGAALVIDLTNGPCTIVGAVIQEMNPDVPDLTTAFPKAALYKRGVVAWVERPGLVSPGDEVRVLRPVQPSYSFA